MRATLSWRVRHALGNSRRLYPPVWRTLGKNAHLLVRRDFDIVLEGFPSSANTFTVLALEKAQDRRIMVAHHHHVACQLLLGHDWGIPCCLLLRDPDDAVRSFCSRSSEVDAEFALTYYIHMHQALRPIRGDIVIAPFELATTAFSSIVEAINARYSASLGIPEDTPERASEVFSEIERLSHSGLGTTVSVAKPQTERHAKRDRIDLSGLEALRSRARRVYEFLMEASVRRR